MKILTYQNGDGGQRLGELAPDSEHVIDLTDVAPDAITLLEGGERTIDAARQHVARAAPETMAQPQRHVPQRDRRPEPLRADRHRTGSAAGCSS